MSAFEQAPSTPPGRDLGLTMSDVGHRRTLLLAIVVATVIVDAATKAVASATLGQETVHILGPFDLRLVHNPGIAFGLGNRAPAGLVLSAALAGVIVLGVAAWRGRVPSTLAAGLIVGGGIGNVVDRMLGGTVVDMFDIGRWPTFNVADTCITVGVALLLWVEVRTPGVHDRG